MVDVRGDVLRPPHGTTPAAVKSNKNQKWDPLRAMKAFIKSSFYQTLILFEGDGCAIHSQVNSTYISLGILP